jgi:hypothetical protein
MEMWLQGIVKTVQYTFIHQGETYTCDFVSNGSIHWMNFGKTNLPIKLHVSIPYYSLAPF